MNRPFAVEVQMDANRVPQQAIFEGMAAMLQAENVLSREQGSYRGPVDKWQVYSEAGLVGLVSPVLPPRMESLNKVAMSLVQASMVFQAHQAAHPPVVAQGQRQPQPFMTPVTKRCTYSLFIEITDLCLREIAAIAKFVQLVEPVILSSLPPSRQPAQAGQEAPANLKHLASWVGDANTPTAICAKLADSSAAFSIRRFATKGLVEIRYSTSTTDPNKINYWVVFWQHLIEAASRMTTMPNVTNMAQLLDAIGLREGPKNLRTDTRRFMIGRVESMRTQALNNIRRQLDEARPAAPEAPVITDARPLSAESVGTPVAAWAGADMTDTDQGPTQEG